MNVMEAKIIQEYKNIAIQMIMIQEPAASFEDINNAIDYSILKRMKNGNVVINNNYTKEQLSTTLIELTEYIMQREPIITAYGVMFKKHGEEPNPIAKLIEGFIEGRKKIKKEMFKHPKGSEEFEALNLQQLLAKIDANGFYGACGQFSCIYYNLYVAASTTTQGQSAISAAGLLFEMFLANNVGFRSLNEVITFINNIINEEPIRRYNDNIILDENISVESCFYKIMTTCNYDWIPTEKDMCIVWDIVSKLSQRDINRLYYKNNLYDFVDNSKVSAMLIEILKLLNNPYLDPNTIPEEISVELEEFWNLLKEYVYYSYQIIDRIGRLTYMPRAVTAIIDTDSNILSLDAWYRFVLSKVENIDMKIKIEKQTPAYLIKVDEFGDADLVSAAKIINDSKDYDFTTDTTPVVEGLIPAGTISAQDGLRYSIINILAYCLSNMINDYMERYTMNSHSYAQDKKCLLIMKNEFLFKRALINYGKKHYATLQELQEGNYLGGYLDIKGLELAKSGAAKDTQDRLKNILNDFILKPDEIDLVAVLKELAKFEKDIYNSLVSGEKKYYKPVRIKSASSYEDPFRIQGVKASYIWNYIKDPEGEVINLDRRNSVDIVKVVINTKTVEKIRAEYPETYNKIIALMNSNSRFNKTIDSIAIPAGSDVPKWLLEFIDYTSIINDNLKMFPLEPLSIVRGRKENNFTNIIKLS